MVTLFQLFTLDHWYDILRDLIKVVDPITVEIYIILWICIGAFIFRNIFAGIMGIHAMSFFNYNESNLKLTSSSSKIRGQNSPSPDIGIFEQGWGYGQRHLIVMLPPLFFFDKNWLLFLNMQHLSISLSQHMHYDQSIKQAVFCCITH